MLYIKKEGLPNSVNQQIIEILRSDNWKSVPDDDTQALRSVFDNEFPKSNVKKLLIHEQKGLCAYCMRRIHMDSYSRIEHIIPLSKNKDTALNYGNLLGVCDGGKHLVGEQNHILCCDAEKGEKEISISLLNEFQMDKIAYKKDGTIYTNPEDEAMEKDMNEILHLNGIRNRDGSVLDTSTEILKGRRDTYFRVQKMMEMLAKQGKCTSAEVKKIIDNLKNKEEFEEYQGVKLYYFRKKYDSLVKRGL